MVDELDFTSQKKETLLVNVSVSTNTNQQDTKCIKEIPVVGFILPDFSCL